MNWTIIIIETIWGMLIGLIPCLVGAGIYAWLMC